MTNNKKLRENKIKQKHEALKLKKVAEYSMKDEELIRDADIERFQLKPLSYETKRTNSNNEESKPKNRREWKAPANVETGGTIHPTRFVGGHYVTLYRAMPKTEYYHLRKHGYLKKGASGHQGFAPNRAYSYKYMCKSYTHLVEFDFPSKFMEEMYKQGWTEGKLEKRAFSWGIGSKASNSFMSNNQRKALSTQTKKKSAKHPYLIYLNWCHAIRWRVVNIRIQDN